MKILFVASECVPYAKAGGLGDVVGALPKALAELGHDVRVVMPRYGFIDSRHFLRHAAPLGVPLGAGEAWCGVLEAHLPGSEVPVYLLEHDELFGSMKLYDAHTGVKEMARFALLSRGAFQLCRYLHFTPDVMHVHDWPTAWVPVLLEHVENEPPFAEVATVFSLHNVAHQPRFPAEGLSLLHLGPEAFNEQGLEDHGFLNPFKAGAWYSTMLVAVSPSYALEIRSEPGGAGLHQVFDYRGADLVGILNGIDDAVWDPETDSFLPAHFSVDDLEGKAVCKRELQIEMGLEVRPDVPLFGMICRMTHQKGVDLAIEVLPDLLQDGAQLAFLGSGDPTLELALTYAARAHPGRVGARIGYSEGLAHRIEAGSDFFLMPSRFEPCGLNQMYSQRYATLPVVRSVGGLRDTVETLEIGLDSATGFAFGPPTPAALAEAVRQATRTYRQSPELIARMRLNGMRKDFGWGPAARRYEDVYGWAVAKRAAWKQLAV